MRELVTREEALRLILERARRLDAESVRAFADGKLARFKVPRYVLVVEEFLMTVTGKVRKVEMRAVSTEQLGLG